MSGSVVASFRGHLRTETAVIHRATDLALTTHADVATLDGYSRFLSIMGSVILTFGAHLDAASVAAGLAARSAPLLEGIAIDLARCETPAPMPDRNQSAVGPHSDEPSYAAGVGYTLEGSSMGADVLRRRVTSGLPDASTNYFDALLTNRLDRWKHYCGWLDESTRPSNAQSEAARGATDVFALISKHLDESTKNV